MDAKKWKARIKKAAETVGTYQEPFDDVITTLADMLAERDRIYIQYVEEGAHPLVEVISDRGQSNLRDNPLLTTWRSINRDALQYWRDLGLTPAGLKKIVEDSMKPAEQSPLDKVLANLEKGSEPKTPKRTVKKTVTKTKSKAKPKTTKAGKK